MPTKRAYDDVDHLGFPRASIHGRFPDARFGIHPDAKSFFAGENDAIGDWHAAEAI